jgi:hypothetical protein
MNTRKRLEQNALPSSQSTPHISLWFCLSMNCAPKEWFVWQDAERDDGWAITENVTGTPYSLAADVPICPHCGENLHKAALEEKSYLS